MKQEIEKKIKYWENQLSRATDRFINENTRKTRDEVIKIREKVRTYQECLTLIKQLWQRQFVQSVNR